MTVAPWVERLRETNRVGQDPAKAVVAHLHPGEVSASFDFSLRASLAFDLATNQRLVNKGNWQVIATQQGAGRLERGRNEAARMFLDQHPDADILVFVDSDMGWDADAIERLCTVIDSDPNRFPIVGGLCFGVKPTAMVGQAAMELELFPTIYRWAQQPGGPPGFDAAYTYPNDQVVECAATGAAFVAIHRWALEAMRATGAEWFDTWTEPWTDSAGNERSHPFGEDLSFCLRARSLGIPIHVHTGVKTSHHKSQWVTEDTYLATRDSRASAVTIIIPVLDNFDMTRNLISDLICQGGWTDILIIDNGSTDPEMVEWLQTQDIASVFDAKGHGITQMWNFGIEEARKRHGGLADLIFLNNDLRLGPSFCQRLIGGLRRSGAAVVSGNYDGRPGTGVQPVQGIAAGRMDYSGGMAGFAFAMSAEWASQWQFLEGTTWWYGDTDLAMSIDVNPNAWQGIVTSALVQHLEGGSQTERPADWDQVIEADKAAFMAKWPQVQLVATPA